MTADYYSILGVSPAAEDVVIRAAYRALIRHYHPDTNPDPQAQEKAREITAAFAVLRDPAARAEYDSRRTGGAVWISDEIRIPPDRPRPPAMRGLALASAAVAVALVAAVLVLPQPQPPGGRKPVVSAAPRTEAVESKPVVELAPESERIARLRGDSGVIPAPPQPVPLVDQPAPLEPPIKPAISMPVIDTTPVRIPAPAPRRAVHQPAPVAAMAAITVAKPKVVAAPPEPSAGCRPDGSVAVSVGCKNERLATLDRMAAGFFSQSMAHADAAKRQLLLSSHTRSAETRSACRSDSCVSEAYLRQMREISAIMEGRTPPTQ